MLPSTEASEILKDKIKKIQTLAIIEKDNKVLLAMKKRGFGVGWWNGYGGKLIGDETIEEAMLRELKEESKIIGTKFNKRGVVNFFFEDSDSYIEMHIYEITDYIGEAEETEEMAPRWFDKSQIPLDQMWPADRQWLPLYFAGKNVEGSATFNGETNELIEANFKAVT